MLRVLIFIVAVVGAIASASAADDLPRRKSGLWSLSVMTPGTSVPMTMQQCVDERSDDMTATLADKSKQACKSTTKREGGSLVFDATCKLALAGGKARQAATTSKTHGVFTGDPKSSYTFESTTTFDPPMAGTRAGVTKATAQWVGPCRAGMKPGDVQMSNGVKFNVNDYQNQAAHKK